MNAYDRYLEFQLGLAGGFMTLLFRAIEMADEGNRKRLAKGFPEEVAAYEAWAGEGTDAVYSRASDSDLVRRMNEVY